MDETTWPEVAHYAVSCGLVAWFAGIGLVLGIFGWHMQGPNDD